MDDEKFLSKFRQIKESENKYHSYSDFSDPTSDSVDISKMDWMCFHSSSSHSVSLYSHDEVQDPISQR